MDDSFTSISSAIDLVSANQKVMEQYFHASTTELISDFSVQPLLVGFAFCTVLILITCGIFKALSFLRLE